MAKRFTDSDKWKDNWFIDLPLKAKVFWFYVLDNCTFFGTMDINYRLIKFYLNENIDRKFIEENFAGKIIFLEENKIFIKNFIDFQYGDLNENNRVHKSIINKLAPYKPLISPLQRAKEKEEDKDKEKEKEKDKDRVININKIIQHWNSKNGLKKSCLGNEINIQQKLAMIYYSDEKIMDAINNYAEMINNIQCWKGYKKNPYLLSFLQTEKIEKYLSENFDIKDFISDEDIVKKNPYDGFEKLGDL